jgi:SAM-dependent methyltransferase
MNLSEVTNPQRYNDKSWLDIHHRLEKYALDKHCFQNTSGEIYRKGWEWTHCLYGLQELGCLRPEANGIGVGVGREPVIFYLADVISGVTATDLYDNAEWTDANGREASKELVELAKRACPESVDFSKIAFENQNGTALSYADNSFDFAWSLSSIEHFGGHRAAQKALAEMGRVIKPGGIVAVATEMLILPDQKHPEYFARQELFDELINPCKDLELVDEINFNTLPMEYLVDSIVIPAGADRRRRHVVLNDGEVQWTSVLFFLRKKSR